MLALLAAALLALQPPAEAGPPVRPAATEPAAAGAAVPHRAGPVILVSLDGFRADYLTRGVTPRLLSLAREGAWAAEGMRPSFPSVTFPNHYTLVTGLRPDRHGIVANVMDDPTVTGDTHFTMSDVDAASDRRWWDGAEPIWVSAHRAGLRTAVMFWPGSEAPIGGVRPDHWAHFDAAVSFDHRVDVALDWLRLPADKRPDLVLLYLDEPDHTGHEAGPDSPAVLDALRRVDAAIGRLVDGLKAQGLSEGADLVVVADHGMAGVSDARVLFVDDWVPDMAAVRAVEGGPVAGYDLQGPGAAAAERAIVAPHAHARCWRKADVPPSLHYGANARVPAVVCLADVGWIVTTRAAFAKRKAPVRGAHGYDPAAPEMRALFLAHGPAFRRGARLPVFDNVDVQPLLAHLLHVAAPAGDGSLAPLEGALRER